jgi:proline-specific peptidase
MNGSAPAREGYVSFHGFNVWYRVVGDREEPGKIPLLCLHGGPGFAWDTFEPLEALAASGRRVVFYDQLGGGNSDEPHNPAMYTVDLYVEEVGEVRRALGLDRVHILGHSWGGMLALEYALTRPAGLASLILADTSASIPRWEAAMRRLVADLPAEAQEAIRVHEAAGTTNSPEYAEACRAYSRRHLGGRMDPRPECLTRIFSKPGEEVYETMWGPSEWCVSGTLRDWDVESRLGEITAPTLVIGGRYDEATPPVTEALHRGIAGSEWVIFEESGHFPHLEETERYLEVLSGFLDRVEGRG